MSDSERIINYDDYPQASYYGYRPDEGAAIAFIVIFSVLGLAHIAQGVRYKYWIVFPTIVTGCIGEVIGWSGRLWSHKNLNLQTPFMMQIASLIISPVFFSAFLYTMLGHAVERINPAFCMLTSRKFVAIFLTADIVSLVLQAIGGGWAASVTPSPDAASNLMLAGIAFQLGVMIIFIIIGLDFCLRIWKNKPYGSRVNKLGATTSNNMEMGTREFDNESRRTSETHLKGTGAGTGAGNGVNGQNWTGMSRGWWLFMFGMLISSIAIIIRGIYRTAELAEGWDGELIKQEGLQNGLDGAMMVVAVLILNVLHMGFLLPRKPVWKGVL